MAKKQTSLLGLWSTSSQKKVEVESVEDSSDSEMEDEITEDIDLVDQDRPSPMPVVSEISDCSRVCCSDETKAYQPTDKFTLQCMRVKSRNFQSSWFKQFSWISVCVSRKKVFCLYCKHAKKKHELVTFSRCGDKAFTDCGFQNWKKAVAKFKDHESSHFHQEAKMKWIAQEQPTIGSQLSSQQNKLQQTRRAGLLKQLRGIQYLTRQGVALQGHRREDGNLHQLLVTWSHDCEIAKSWLKANRYTCHQSVNDLINIMGQKLLRALLARIRAQDPAWFAVIVDEATDVCSTEQLNLSICWVSNKYEAFEDPIGLFRVPDTKAETLYKVIKDLLIRCELPLDMCRGQAYDGAANMQGKRSGVAARFLADNSAAVPVHCFAHSLNLCLQGIGRNIVCLRDALDVVREIGKLIKFSPKRLHLFFSATEEDTVSLKHNSLDCSYSSN